METSRTTVSVRLYGPPQGASAIRTVKARATAARRGPGVVPRAPRHPRGVFGVYWSDFASLIADLMFFPTVELIFFPRLTVASKPSIFHTSLQSASALLLALRCCLRYATEEASE